MVERGWAAWFDGAADPNPGRAGFGAVLARPDGSVLELFAPIGHATNNVAEYKGLIAVLEAAIVEGAQRLAVMGDSKLVVEQVNGRWAVKSETLAPLCRAAKALMARLPGTCLTWIPREENGHADLLSKRALGKGDEHTDEPGWDNLTALGKLLGCSAVAAGRRLDAAGLRTEGRPSTAALEQRVARSVEHHFGTRINWHTTRAALALATAAKTVSL